jgi:hypothetical protein
MMHPDTRRGLIKILAKLEPYSPHGRGKPAITGDSFCVTPALIEEVGIDPMELYKLCGEAYDGTDSINHHDGGDVTHTERVHVFSKRGMEDLLGISQQRAGFLNNGFNLGVA